MRTVSLLLFAAVLASDGRAPKAGAELKASGRIWFEIDSNLQRFHLEARRFDARLRAEKPSADAFSVIAQHRLSKMVVEIPVESLTASDPLLDAGLSHALGGKDFPSIVFTLDGYQVLRADPDLLELRASARLSLGGVERPYVVRARLAKAGGRAWLTGSFVLKMSDHGLTPPRVLFGALHAEDDLVVGFALKLSLD